jgi:hypothetical protein
LTEEEIRAGRGFPVAGILQIQFGKSVMDHHQKRLRRRRSAMATTLKKV